MPTGMPALDSQGAYVGFGWLQISVPNLIVIIAMVILFTLAVLLPFPGGNEDVTQ